MEEQLYGAAPWNGFVTRIPESDVMHPSNVDLVRVESSRPDLVEALIFRGAGGQGLVVPFAARNVRSPTALRAPAPGRGRSRSRPDLGSWRSPRARRRRWVAPPHHR